MFYYVGCSFFITTPFTLFTPPKVLIAKKSGSQNQQNEKRPLFLVKRRFRDFHDGGVYKRGVGIIFMCC